MKDTKGEQIKQSEWVTDGSKIVQCNSEKRKQSKIF